MAVANWYDALRPQGGEASERVAEGGKCGVVRAGMTVETAFQCLTSDCSQASSHIGLAWALRLFNSPHTLGTTPCLVMADFNGPSTPLYLRRYHIAPNNVPP
jgi:hypothetical protein